MKKLKNGRHFININRTEKFQITDSPQTPPPPQQSLGLWLSGCQQKWNISVSHYEKIKKWPPFHKYQSYGKISNYRTPPQSLYLQFSKCQQKWNISIKHCEKIEKWPPFHKYQSYGKFSNYQFPQNWVSSFLSADRNIKYQCWPL